jgi:hypothetical protein
MFGSLGSIAKSVTGISKAVTGTTKNFRQVLAANPSALSITLPPQVTMGITVANSLGLKIPTADVLTKQVMSELDKSVFGIYRASTTDLINALNGVDSAAAGLDQYLSQLTKEGSSVLDKVKIPDSTTVDGILNQISWLL